MAKSEIYLGFLSIYLILNIALNSHFLEEKANAEFNGIISLSKFKSTSILTYSFGAMYFKHKNKSQ